MHQTPCTHASTGSLTPEEREAWMPGECCGACGRTVGTDGYWYVERDEAPGYPFTEAEADEHAGRWE